MPIDPTGRRGERAAERFLRRRGWSILARNWRGGGGEIDLVARRGDLLAVVEVKTRGSPDARAEALTARQRDRILRAAGAYLAARPDLGGAHVRFDLLTVDRGWPWPRVRHTPGAFEGPAGSTPGGRAGRRGGRGRARR